MYFTSKKYFTNFETQVEFFALLQLMEKTEDVNPDIFYEKWKIYTNPSLKHFSIERLKCLATYHWRVLKLIKTYINTNYI